MYGVELYAAVRLAVVDEGLSHHEAGRQFGIDRRTVKKMLSYSAPPGYRRTKPVRRLKLDAFTGIVDAILEADTDPDVPRKERHTAHRIFERLGLIRLCGVLHSRVNFKHGLVRLVGTKRRRHRAVPKRNWRIGSYCPLPPIHPQSIRNQLRRAGFSAAQAASRANPGAGGRRWGRIRRGGRRLAPARRGCPPPAASSLGRG